MSRTGAHAQWKTGGAAVAAPTSLYLVETAPDVYELADAGPAEAAFVITDSVIQIHDDPAAAGALSPILLGSTVYLTEP